MKYRVSNPITILLKQLTLLHLFQSLKRMQSMNFDTNREGLQCL